MAQRSKKRLEIFLALAHRFAAPQNVSETDSAAAETFGDEAQPKVYAALSGYLTSAEATRFERLKANIQKKSEAEKSDWIKQTLEEIGTDEQLIDDTVHQSHVVAASQKEPRGIRKIIEKGVFAAPILESNDSDRTREIEKATALEKTVRRAFAKQFVALRDLPQPTAFDRLSGAELARLIRLAGIREVALACVRIEAVESIAAFLRRFSAEDARAVAAQIANFPDQSEPRLAFAEQLVQTALEIEPQPSAMLDSLGIWLTGVLLCVGANNRVRYTIQKLPVEASGKLLEIIDEQCRRTPADLLSVIGKEIERLAETIARHAMRG